MVEQRTRMKYHLFILKNGEWTFEASCGEKATIDFWMSIFRKQGVIAEYTAW